MLGLVFEVWGFSLGFQVLGLRVSGSRGSVVAICTRLLATFCRSVCVQRAAGIVGVDGDGAPHLAQRLGWSPRTDPKTY